MSARRPDFRPSDDEPAVINPTLRAMVDAARQQPAPTVELSAEALHEQWAHHRARRRRALGLGVGFAVAACVAVLLVKPGSVDDPTGAGTAVTPELASTEPTTNVGHAPEVVPTPVADRPLVVIADDVVASAEPALELASSIEVLALEESDGAPTVLGPRRLELPDGRWSLSNPDESAMIVVAGTQTLEFSAGRIHVEVAGDVARVEVLSGTVQRFDAEGRAVPAPSVDPQAIPSADAMAREAEAHLLAGRRRQAIKSLRRLVSTHPRSSATPTALIDLGRLLERAGRSDEARCTYATFMIRWPLHNLLGDVRRAHDALGDGPRCRGLRPRR